MLSFVQSRTKFFKYPGLENAYIYIYIFHWGGGPHHKFLKNTLKQTRLRCFCVLQVHGLEDEDRELDPGSPIIVSNKNAFVILSAPQQNMKEVQMEYNSSRGQQFASVGCNASRGGNIFGSDRDASRNWILYKNCGTHKKIFFFDQNRVPISFVKQGFIFCGELKFTARKLRVHVGVSVLTKLWFKCVQCSKIGQGFTQLRQRGGIFGSKCGANRVSGYAHY